MARNRVIYQSEALFVSPNATGAHFICDGLITGGGATGTSFGPNPVAQHMFSAIGIASDPFGLKEDFGVAQMTDAKLNSDSNDMAVTDFANLSGAITGSLGANLGLNSKDATSITNGGTTLFTNITQWETFLDSYNGINSVDSNYTTGVLLHPFSGSYTNLVQQLHRVQSANYNFTINRTDVNTFGQLARIDAIALEPPTVNLDFTYYPTDGFNERNLGFYVQGANDKGEGMGKAQLSSAKGHLQDDSAGRNFFILTTPEGTDAFNTTSAHANRSVISLGNGYLSDYSLEASVGSIPSVSSTVELFNAKSDKGTTGVNTPGVNLSDGSALSGITFTVGSPSGLRPGELKINKNGGQSPSTGDAGVSALRPGDITMDIPEGLSIFADVSGDGGAHIQNFNLSLPLARSPIDRLGTRFAFSRVVDFPVVATMSVSALVSEVNEGNLAEILDDCEERDVKITMKANTACGEGETKDSMIIDFKGARIDSESISSDIGSNKSVDLTFTTQIGGPEDLIHGVFISGANRAAISGHVGIPGR